MNHHVRRGRVALRRALGTFVAVMVVALAAASAYADPGDVGHEGASFAGGAAHNTGYKAESKLWWNDGFWWASMYYPGEPNVTAAGYYIHRLDLATHTWVRTPTLIDNRATSRADALWDQTAGKLYVASHTASGAAKLYRFSYNASTDTYTRDFVLGNIVGTTAPANVPGDVLTIAKDSTGQLWATWQAGGQIWVNRSTGADNTWGTPYVPNVDGSFPGAASATSTKDVSAVVSFEGKIGLMWSNEAQQVFYFAVHNDADADETWLPSEKVREGAGKVDDHVALRSFASLSDGRLFAVTKTTHTGGSSPSIELQARSATGVWSTSMVTSAQYNQTRPILLIDSTNSLLHVFTAEEGDGAIYEKTSPLSAISFTDGKGTPVMLDVAEPALNDPSSTKQVVNSTTGLVVVGNNTLTSRYWHHYSSLGGAPPPPTNVAPVANGDTYTTAQDTPLVVPAPGVLTNDTDANGDALTAAKTANPAHGTATVNANGSFTYTPTAGYSGPDSFQYKASDGSLQSAAATVSITVTPAGGGGGTTLNPIDDAFVQSNAPGTNNGTQPTLRVYKSGSTETNSYLKFVVPAGTVTSAKLRLYVQQASGVGGSIYPVSAAWEEETVTWGTKPAASGGSLGSFGAVASGNWVELNVSSYVTGPGTYSFLLKDGGTPAAWYHSKEGANDPQLVLGGGGGGGNTAPVAVNDSGYTTPMNTALVVSAPGVLANDTDADGNALTATKTANPAHGTATVNANGSFTYTPTAGYTGPDSFTYKASDGTAQSANATVSITVAAGNTAPVAVNDGGYTTPQNTALHVSAPGVLANDTDADGNALTAAKTANPAHGTVTVDADGSFTYTPTAGYSGPDSFTYKASDGTAQSANATVSITVNAAPPTTTTFTANADAYVHSATPGGNFGSAPSLRVYKSGATETHTYIKFVVSGTVSSAKLRLRVTQSSGTGGSVYPVTASWSEGTITWGSKPAASGGSIGLFGAVTAGTWVELNVSSIVTGAGTYTFLIKDGASPAAWYSSKEGANAPQLVVVS